MARRRSVAVESTDEFTPTTEKDSTMSNDTVTDTVPDATLSPEALANLSPAEADNLLKTLRAQRKAAREAAKAAREAAKGERAESVAARAELSNAIFGDSVRELLARTDKIVTGTFPNGFNRHTGTVEVDGVRYNAVLTVQVARKRGRPKSNGTDPAVDETSAVDADVEFSE